MNSLLVRVRSGLLFLLVGLLLRGSTLGQPVGARSRTNRVWTGVENLPGDRAASDFGVRASKFKSFHLDHDRLRQLLAGSPDERLYALRTSPAIIELPMPDGTLARFRFVESPVMATELAAKFPEIKTYQGEGVDDPNASVRFDLTPAGFHAQILSPTGTWYIDPAFRSENQWHTSYYKRDYERAPDEFQCFVASDARRVGRSADLLTGPGGGGPVALARSGNNLRTYRLAMAATAEYTAFHGGTVAAGLAAIVTAVNRVTGIYESELTIRFVLVANNDLIVYTNAGTDPYSNGNSSSLLNQNQATLDGVIGSANYDIGHVVGTAGGGLASVGVVCLSGQKAHGETGVSPPAGDAFHVDYIAHEIGHQFGAEHPFNGTASNCGSGNRNAATAYEPGSGSTIMAYAGICGSDDLQAHSDPYFHSINFDEIIDYSTSSFGNNCAVITSTGNTAPVLSAGVNYIIPRDTPFTLTATGSDPDGDPLTYCWEQRDLGPATSVSAPDNGSSPIFRSWSPSPSPARNFPRLLDLLNNTLAIGEVMPTTTRTLHFRVTARDHRPGGGGVSTADMQVIVAAAGPFLVTSHNDGGTFSGVQTVTWKVADTAGPPVNTANVNILLSTDGGLTFPITLAANTPNDGSETVVFPDLKTGTARLRVEATGNIYFDLGNANFSILPDIPAPFVALDSAALVAEKCAGTNNAIDPGELVTVNFALKNIGTLDATNVVATLRLTNGVASTSGAQAYGLLSAGGAPVVLPFTFSATGACGGVFTASLQLHDGGSDLGFVNHTFDLGSITAEVVARTNSASISIPVTGTSGKSAPFPSTVNISGVNGPVQKVTVTLRGLTHTWPADLDLLLVGPTGQSLLLLSDAGGGNPVSGLTLTFADDAAETVPELGTLTSGSFRPGNYGGGDTFSSPAPGGAYGSTLAVFQGLNPNGSWSLYVQDDSSRDTGSIAQGWQLSITTSNATCCDNNSSPFISALGNVVTNEDSIIGPLVFTIGDAETPSESLALTVDSSNPLLVPSENVHLSGRKSSRSVTIVPAPNQFGDALLTIAVSDGRATATNAFTVTFLPVNDPPVLWPIPDFTIVEGQPFTYTNTFADPEAPPQNLWFHLASAPLNAAINPTNGVLNWTPSETQGGSTNFVLVTVTDDGSPGLSAAQGFVVRVLKTNSAPLLAAIADHKIHAGTTLVITNTATDPDLPPNALTFNLDPVSPPAAQIDATNGVFTWTPADEDANAVQSFTVRATDDGLPVLSDSRTFLVTVVPRPAITDVTITNGNVQVTWTSLAGQSYRLQSRTALTDTNWVDVLPEVTSVGPSAMQTDGYDPESSRFYRVMVLP